MGVGCDIMIIFPEGKSMSVGLERTGSRAGMRAVEKGVRAVLLTVSLVSYERELELGRDESWELTPLLLLNSPLLLSLEREEETSRSAASMVACVGLVKSSRSESGAPPLMRAESFASVRAVEKGVLLAK